MSLAFLNLKGFHPSNFQNQKKLFLAEEREKDRVKRAAERERTLQQEEVPR
jgi:hypothetical protein